MMKLRDYQEKIISDCREKMASGYKSILVTSPTGSGKTMLVAHMLKTAAKKGMPSIFLVHRRELIKQTSETFKNIELDHGIISNGFEYHPNKTCYIASVQSLSRRHTYNFIPKLAVYDESHHCASKTWKEIKSRFDHAYHIGLTATPERLDGKGLSDIFQTMVIGPNVKNLICLGWLSDYSIYSTPGISTEGIKTIGGDYKKDDLEKASNKPSITGDVISHYKRLADGKKAIIYCVSINHSKDVVAKFQAAGYSAAHLDGDTNVRERDDIVRLFKQGQIRILSNVDLFGEGFDLPDIEVAILLRPTKSLALYIQQVGRALRPFTGKKEAIIIDHAGNCQRHGLPCEERNWSLLGRDGRTRSKDVSAVSVKVCPSCFAAQYSGFTGCKICGYIFKENEKKIQEKEGILGKIDKDKFKKQERAAQGMAKTIQELIALGKQRGYKNPWAWAHFVQKGRAYGRN